MKEKMKKVLGSMRKKSTHSGVIDEDIRSTYSAVSMDEPSITSAATSMRTSRSKVGSAFVPVTKTTLPKDISISSPEVVSAKVDEEEDFNKIQKVQGALNPTHPGPGGGGSIFGCYLPTPLSLSSYPLPLPRTPYRKNSGSGVGWGGGSEGMG